MDPIKQFRGKENELMHGLNQRLSGFIDKVHLLQQHNHLLEREISEIRGKAKPASLLEDEYGAELQRLRQLLQEVAGQKHQIQTELLNLEDELCSLRTQQEEEGRCKAAAQRTILVLKRDISDAIQAKAQLDKKAQALEEELHCMKRNHQTEVSQMFAQVQDAQLAPRAQEFGAAGITEALRHIRAQLEERTVSSRPQVGETFRSQFARLTEEAEAKREALKEIQQEIQEHRRRLQAKTVELDCANGTREALERQLREVEDRHKEEIIHYQNTIKELENELINCKFDVSGYLREYQDLLNVKMALDVEILSYRKLLCGEEAQLSTVSDTHTSLPYIYHQSPVYTLSSLSRPGGPHRRAEPQYKFVEEIITETTREYEMSEFEETGSEETEVGRDDPVCTKRDSGSSEEEMDNKDSGKDIGEQMCDSEQNQKSSVGGSVNGGDDGSPAGVDEGQKRAEKSEVDGNGKGDSGIDKTSQSQVLSTESTDDKESKQSEEGTGKIKGEKEAVEAQKATDSTAAENSVSAVLGDEISEKIQELSLSTPKKEGKEVMSVDRVARSTRVAKQDSNNGLHKESAHKLSAESLPEVEIPKSGEKAEMVQTGMAKEMAEIKDFEQETAESNQGLISKLSEVSSKIKDVKSSRAEK